MQQELLEKYARFIVRTALNVQPRQTLLLRCPVTESWFAHLCSEQAFAAGAKDVIVRYEDEAQARLRYERADEADLCTLKPYELRSWLDYAEDPDGCCVLSVHASDPQAFAGLDAGKLSRISAARSAALKEWQEYTMKDKVQWCVVSIPTPAWAARVFPALPAGQACEALWEKILMACRITPDTDPVAAWAEQIAHSTARRDRLNDWKLQSVRFTGSNGTDLTVGLAERAVWEGASSHAENGVSFIANIPTEEIFTAPHRDKVDGVVYGTRPYVYNGQIIEGFCVTFEKGRVVSHSAAKGDALLGQLLSADENACRIGEVALVPASSPIRQSGVLFFNTLFDENAACHIAFGAGYPTNIAGGAALDRAALMELGLNDSVIHEDVMIGDHDTRVTGLTAAGETVTLFENGEWAF